MDPMVKAALVTGMMIGLVQAVLVGCLLSMIEKQQQLESRLAQRHNLEPRSRKLERIVLTLIALLGVGMSASAGITFFVKQ